MYFAGFDMAKIVYKSKDIRNSGIIDDDSIDVLTRGKYILKLSIL